MDDIKYPCLMIGKSSGTVVLFTSRREGTVKGTGNKYKPYKVGYHSSGWIIKHFEPFIEEVLCDK